VELRHLRYFVAVAEELHFGRAALRLHIAQPPLSHQIRQLEGELGVTLLHRTKRRVELTEAGRVFLAEVYRLFAQVDRAVSTAQHAGRGEIGRLAIGFVPSADLDLLPRVLRVWRERFAHVEVALSALLPEQQVEALHHGRIHVGLLRPPVDERGLVVEPVQREPLVVALPEHHPLAERARVRLADLRDDSLILFPRRVAPAYHDLLVSVCRRAGFTPRVLHETESLQTNLGCVAAGLGVTLLPASIHNLRRAGVVYRPLAPPVPQVELAVAYVRTDPSPSLAAFLQILRQVVEDGPPLSPPPPPSPPSR
jgi:DNA-binding transcriptional LysR family regulator